MLCFFRRTSFSNYFSCHFCLISLTLTPWRAIVRESMLRETTTSIHFTFRGFRVVKCENIILHFRQNFHWKDSLKKSSTKQINYVYLGTIKILKIYILKSINISRSTIAKCSHEASLFIIHSVKYEILGPEIEIRKFNLRVWQS